RAVHRVFGVAPHALHRMHGDDAAAMRLDHRRHERPGDGENMAQVDVVHPLPRVGAGPVEGHERSIVAYVVHQHVDPAVRTEHRVGEARDLVVGGDIDDVTPEGSPGRGHLVAYPLGAFPIDLGHLHECAVGGEQAGDPRTDTVASTGDHRDPSVEQMIPVVDLRDAIVAGHSDGPYAAC